MTSPLIFVIAGALLAGLAPLPTLFSGPSNSSQKISVFIHIIAGIIGTAGAIAAIVLGRSERWLISWGLPFGPAEIGIDPLSGLFLLPIFLISSCCALYSLGYWRAEENPDTTTRLSIFFALLTASLAMIVVARHSVLFLISWEIMAISCYFAMTVDGRKKEVREAGLLYLITAHLGTLALFVFFSQLKAATGSYALPETASIEASTLSAGALFIPALLGFGLKAGIMPLHIWLPSAHANAPSHLSAIMSGVLIKIGIYGIIRTISLFTGIPFWWGVLLLITGIITGVAGVVFAIGQHDLKRLLAYHSIENIGIICMGIGMSLMGISRDIPGLAILGMAGALLHTLNHAIFKSLLFLGAGAVIHECGTREIDQMGGLIKGMPMTSVFFLTGSVAICGLPPLNGFVSEFLIYMGLFRGILDADTLNDPYFALAAPALALIGGLAAACFVKVFGIAFLGSPRSEKAAESHEPGRSMLIPMAVLASLCLLIGVLPVFIAPLLEQTVFSAFPHLAASGSKLLDHANLGMISIAAAILMLLLIIFSVIYNRKLASSPVTLSETWGCGYLAPNPRMQYTSSSFAASIVAIFSGILRPHIKTPAIRGYFPKAATFRSHVPEAILESIYLPLFNSVNGRLSLFRKLQNGKLHLYLLYIVLTLVALMLWSHFRSGR